MSYSSFLSEIFHICLLILQEYVKIKKKELFSCTFVRLYTTLWTLYKSEKKPNIFSICMSVVMFGTRFDKKNRIWRHAKLSLWTLSLFFLQFYELYNKKNYLDLILLPTLKNNLPIWLMPNLSSIGQFHGKKVVANLKITISRKAWLKFSYPSIRFEKNYCYLPINQPTQVDKWLFSLS